MQYYPHVHTVHIQLGRIAENYRLLKKAAQGARADAIPPARLPAAGAPDRHFAWPAAMPVIKADAYGHGHVRVAETLLEEGAAAFASGSTAEAVELRRGLCERCGQTPEILSLLGPINEEDLELCLRHAIIPTIHSFRQTAMLRTIRSPTAIALKFNTGMARLGFEPDEIPALFEALDACPLAVPVLALSHLACADSAQGEREVRLQARAFAGILDRLRRRYPDMAASLANSAGTLLAKDITECIGPHVCRPGIALYGANPFAGTPLARLGEGLLTAMSASVPIIATRELAAGAAVGYGHSFRAAEKTRIGIAAAGYADGYSRFLSNRGAMCVRGKKVPVAGRVSMQMTALDLGDVEDARAGDEAWILGGPYADAISIDELARMWGTVSYEAFCLLGSGTRAYGGCEPLRAEKT